MKTLMVLLVLVLICVSLHAEDWMRPVQICADRQDKYKNLYEAAKVWLFHNSCKKEQDAWTKKFNSRVEDNKDIEEETFTRERLYDFASGHRDEFPKPETMSRETKFWLCMIYLRHFDKGFALHSKIEEHLSQENVTKVVTFLIKDVCKK